jgi:hypothetical protein
MLAFEGGMLAFGGLLMLASSHERLESHGWVFLAAAAGTLLGVSDVALKALTETALSSPLGVISPWTAIAILGGLGAFLALARGLQLGEAVGVIVAFSAAATLAAIAGGILVFGDPLGTTPLAVAGRSSAFPAVIAAAALLPMVPSQRLATPRAS